MNPCDRSIRVLSSAIVDIRGFNGVTIDFNCVTPMIKLYILDTESAGRLYRVSSVRGYCTPTCVCWHEPVFHPPPLDRLSIKINNHHVDFVVRFGLCYNEEFSDLLEWQILEGFA